MSYVLKVHKITLSLKVESVGRSVMSDSASPWTEARQVLLSMEFSRPEYRNGLPFPPPGGLPNPGTEPGLLHLQADSLLSELPGKSHILSLLLPLARYKGMLLNFCFLINVLFSVFCCCCCLVAK